MRYLSIVVLACSLTANTANASTSVDENAGAHFALELSGPSKVKVGDKIKLNLTLTNASALVIEGGKQPGIDHAELTNGIYVHDAQGHVPQKTPYAQALDGHLDKTPEDIITTSIIPFSVRPGDSMQETCLLNDLYNISAPGKYVIQVRNRLKDGWLVKSNKVTVTVTP
jgi:hypothetical protein